MYVYSSCPISCSSFAIYALSIEEVIYLNVSLWCICVIFSQLFLFLCPVLEFEDLVVMPPKTKSKSKPILTARNQIDSSNVSSSSSSSSSAVPPTLHSIAAGKLLVELHLVLFHFWFLLLFNLYV